MGNILPDGNLPDRNTPFGAFIRRVASETTEQDKRSETYGRDYKVNLKRACCLGALNKSNISKDQARYIEYPIAYFNDNPNSRCPLTYDDGGEEERNDNKLTIKYNKDGVTKFSMEYLSEDKKQYKFYMWTNGARNDIPEFKKELVGEKYEYRYSKGTEENEEDMTLRYIELLEEDEDGYKYYSADNFPIGEEDTIKHLENKDTPMKLSNCLIRKSLKLDLYAPASVTTDEQLKEYCNKEPITLQSNKTSWADVSRTSAESKIDDQSDCPNFMSYYCGKLLKDQGCIKKTVVTRDGVPHIKGTYSYGNQFCANAAKGENASGTYATQLRDCKCINSGVGPNLNNTYDPRKFANDNWSSFFQKEDGTLDETKDPYGILSNDDLSKTATEIRQKLLIDDEMLGKNYISNYAINVNEQPFSSQIPWATDSICRSDLGTSSSDYRSNPFIPADARVTQNVTVCNAEMKIQNLEVGNQANIYGNKMINLCGASDLSAEFTENLEKIFSRTSGDQSSLENQSLINDIEGDFAGWMANIPAKIDRIDSLRTSVSTKGLATIITDISQLNNDKSNLELNRREIENSKINYLDIKNSNPNLHYTKEEQDFDNLLTMINNVPDIDEIIDLYETRKTELEAENTDDTSDSTSGTPDDTSGTSDSTSPSGTPDSPSGTSDDTSGTPDSTSGSSDSSSGTSSGSSGSSSGSSGSSSGSSGTSSGSSGSPSGTLGSIFGTSGSSDEDNTLFYLAIGGGVLLVILILVLLMSGRRSNNYYD